MESIKELRQICQGPRKNLDSWHMKYIGRKPSIYITWLLLHTPISANQASLLVIVVSLIAALIFMAGTKPAFLGASIVLQSWFVMDMVDGEIARYRKQTSLSGTYFDALSHYISHPLVFVGIGFGLLRNNNSFGLFLFSLLAAYSVCMITLLKDVFNSVLYARIIKSAAPIYSRDNGGTKEEENIFKRLFSVLHLICTFPTIMNVLLIVSLLNIFTAADLMAWIVKFYAIFATLVWIAKVFVFVKERKPDVTLNDLSQLREE